jgi:hypothetical protein
LGIKQNRAVSVGMKPATDHFPFLQLSFLPLNPELSPGAKSKG